MPRGSYRRLAIAGGVALVAYASPVAWMTLRESSLVYEGARDGAPGRRLPAADAGIPWDTVWHRAADGVPILLLRSRVDQGAERPWALYLHGSSGFLGSRANVARYRLLRDAGFNVLAVEYRGYGLAAGLAQPSEDGLFADATGGLSYILDSLGARPGRVLVYGWSLGSGPAVRLAAESGAVVGALVTEGAFTSLPDVGAELYPWMPVRLLMRNRFDNAARARSLGIPWVVLHGTRDERVPFAHAELLAAATPLARLVPLDATHDDGVVADSAAALAALGELARELQGR